VGGDEVQPPPFFLPTLGLEVVRPLRRGDERRPEVRQTIDDDRLVALVLAKAGFYGGSIERVLAAPVDSVLEVKHFLKYIDEYAETYEQLNTPDK
jgi:hypothetical protein